MDAGANSCIGVGFSWLQDHLSERMLKHSPYLSV